MCRWNVCRWRWWKRIRTRTSATIAANRGQITQETQAWQTLKPEMGTGRQITHITNLQVIGKWLKPVMHAALCNLPGFYPSVELRYGEASGSWTRRLQQSRNPSLKMRYLKTVIAVSRLADLSHRDNISRSRYIE